MRVFPTITQAILLLLSFVLLTLLLYIPVGMVQAIFNITISDNPFLEALLEALAAGIVVFGGFKKTGDKFGEVFRLKSFNPHLLPSMACAITGISILLSDLDNLLSCVLPPPQWIEEVFMDLWADPVNALIMAVIMAPLIEETICRGLILRGFLKNYSCPKAVVVSSLLFAAMHGNPWQFAGAFVFGALFAYLYIHTRSLWICFIGHAIANSVPLAAQYLLYADIPGFSSPRDGGILFQPWWFNLLGLSLAAAGMFRLVRLLREMPQESDGIQTKRYI